MKDVNLIGRRIKVSYFQWDKATSKMVQTGKTSETTVVRVEPRPDNPQWLFLCLRDDGMLEIVVFDQHYTKIQVMPEETNVRQATPAESMKALADFIHYNIELHG